MYPLCMLYSFGECLAFYFQDNKAGLKRRHLKDRGNKRIERFRDNSVSNSCVIELFLYQTNKLGFQRN